MQPGNSIAADLAEQFSKFHAFETQEVTSSDGVRALLAIVPAGKNMVDLKGVIDAQRAVPLRRKGTATLQDIASFIGHVERFKLDRSAVFVDVNPGAPKFVGVFDYHPAHTEPTTADWLGHRAEFSPVLSEPWKAWTAKNGVTMQQAEFAEFIETNVRDLLTPNLDDPALNTLAALRGGKWATPSDMVQLSSNLQVNIESTVRNAQTLATGEVAIVYDEVHKDGAGKPITVPNLFAINVPVFFGGDYYMVVARLRYRVQGSRIVWFYQLDRTDVVFKDAINGMIDRVKTENGLPVFLGTPEK